MRLKAVFFDIDGTLYPNWSMYYHMIFSMIFEPLLSIRFSKARKAIRKLDESQQPSDFKTFRQKQAEIVCSYYKHHVDVSQMERRIEKSLYKNWESSFRGVSLYNGVKPLLEFLKEKGLKVGLLSDFPIQNKLRYLGIPSSLIDYQICAEDLGALKPHIRPFKAISEISECDPNEILYVGNSYSKDIVGAKNAGMITAHLTKKKVENSVADITFRDYIALKEKIQKLIIA